MLPIHLANIKSSGVYRFTFDNSLVQDQSTQTLRLVVGYSEKGPFNTCMYIENESQFLEVYGDSTKKLEKRGIYFHRIAKQCLAKSPIICLNLKKFGDEVLTGYSFDAYTDWTEYSAIAVEDIYDTSRFWTLDPEKLGDDDVYKFGSVSSYINIVSTGDSKTSCSVMMRPADAHSYDMTVTDWYQEAGVEIPEYLEDYGSMYVSDFFVDVYVFRNDFTNPTSSLTKYFDLVDEKYLLKSQYEGTDMLEYLANNIDAAGYITKYTGSLLPFFNDLDGSPLSVDLLFNADNTTHQLMMFLNYELLDNEDMTVKDINVSGLYQDGLEIKFEDNSVTWGVNSEGEPDKSITAVFVDDNNYETYANIDVRVFTKDTTTSYLQYISRSTPETTAEVIPSDLTASMVAYAGEAEDNVFGFASDVKESDDAYLSELYGDGSEYTLSHCMFMKSTLNKIGYSSPVAVGDTCIVADVLTTIKSVQLYSVPTNSEDEDDTYVFIEFSDDIYTTTDDLPTYTESGVTYTVGLVKCNLRPKLTKWCNRPFMYCKGYTYNNGKPGGTSMKYKLEWQQSIIDTITDYKGMYIALTESNDLDYRYIIDTFESYIDSGLKDTFSQLAMDKGNALFIGNLPSMKSFMDCPYTSFCDSDGNFSTDYIVTGGEGSVKFSLPLEANGASFAAFYTPLKFTDSNQKVDMPSAGIVSNNFMDKYTSRQPYYVVAGPNYGRMVYENLIGPDFNYAQSDRDNLEPIGMNVMIYKPQKGTYINSNQTAKQTPVTALSKVNIRELVIYLQDEVAKVLQNYQWELNTTSLRATIKSKADAICERVMANGGLYAYYNQCDDLNNTSEVIDNEMLVLSTSIEPAKGAGKMVHELTIYNTGEMASSIS